MDHGAWRNLASAYSETGDDAQWQSAMRGALRRAEVALAVNPADPDLLASVATYREGTGDRDGARQAAAQAARLAPAGAGVQYEVSVVFALIGDSDTALDALEAAVDAGHTLDGVGDVPAFAAFLDDPRFASLVQRATVNS